MRRIMLTVALALSLLVLLGLFHRVGALSDELALASVREARLKQRLEQGTALLTRGAARLESWEAEDCPTDGAEGLAEGLRLGALALAYPDAAWILPSEGEGTGSFFQELL